MKEVMSKNITENSCGIIDDIQTLNKSIENVQQQLNILTKKIDKLTNNKKNTEKNK